MNITFSQRHSRRNPIQRAPGFQASGNNDTEIARQAIRTIRSDPEACDGKEKCAGGQKRVQEKAFELFFLEYRREPAAQAAAEQEGAVTEDRGQELLF